MKNPTILRDELSLLNSDKSAVITELRKNSKELKEIQTEILKSEDNLRGVRDTIIKETARLDDIRNRAVLVKGEFNTTSQDLRNGQASYETFRVKKSQEERLHLGRIKELSEKESAILEELAKLKALFDKNSDTYAQYLSDKLSELRNLDTEIKTKTSLHSKLTKELERMNEEDKKITKERLKREDKIRERERVLDMNEKVITKREEDLITMSNDILIVYGRLKELYATVNPDVNLDKLILQAK